jgi:hypothetical protein
MFLIRIAGPRRKDILSALGLPLRAAIGFAIWIKPIWDGYGWFTTLHNLYQ